MLSRRISTCFLGALAAAAVAGGSSSARAEGGLALDRFDPAPAGDRMFGVESPFAAGRLTPHAMLLADYAHNPLVLRTAPDGKGLGSVVSGQLILHLNASLALFDRVNVNLDVPVALLQTGDSPTGQGYSFTSPTSAQLSDVRVGLRLKLVGDYFDLFQLAIGGYVWVPTGATGTPGKESFVSDGAARGRPELIAGGRGEKTVWSFAIGPEFRSATTFASVDQGTMLRFGGGFGYLLGDTKHLQIGPEASVAMVLSQVNRHTVNAEALVDARYRVIDDVEIGLGIGPGFTAGIGTPDFRGVAMVAYTPEQHPPRLDRDGDGVFDDEDACIDVPGVRSAEARKNGCPLPKDRDKDGILDVDDACPDDPGLPNDDKAKNGCPPPKDRDHDGIIDELDACPDEPGVANPDAKKNGCPSDRDDDGIPDAKDACPDLKGVASFDPAQNGCPPDTDGDGIRDDKDACPKEKGKPDPDPQKNGCPTVHVGETEIFVLEQVQFDTAQATIKKVSDDLLDKVAAVFADHTEITRVEVQGHTDNVGLKTANQTLSQNRAKAVVKALVKRGIASSRLVPKGYGQDVPIATNDSDEGRQKNRRVQFKIVEKAPKKQ